MWQESFSIFSDLLSPKMKTRVLSFLEEKEARHLMAQCLIRAIRKGAFKEMDKILSMDLPSPLDFHELVIDRTQLLTGVSKNVNFNRVTFGTTILHTAASCNNVEIFKRMLCKSQDHSNFDFKVVDAHGDTLLHSAVLSGCHEVVNVILEHPSVSGDLINSRNRYGRTALYHADDVRILGKLLAAGANIRLKDRGGISPLDLFTWRGDFDLVHLLVTTWVEKYSPHLKEKEGRFLPS